MAASQSHRVIAVSDHESAESDGNWIKFTANLSKEGDRNRLIAFLKSENMQIDKIIHNQPFMLKPTPKEI